MIEYCLMGVKLNDVNTIDTVVTYYKNNNIVLDDVFKLGCLELNTINNKMKNFIIYLFDRKQEMKRVYQIYKKHNIKDIKIK